MVRHHVTQRSCHIKVAAAFFHSYGFGHGDLDVVNKAVVPHRLKDAVAETEDQDVLHGLFTKIVVDAEDLVLAEGLLNLLIEMSCRFEIIAKGLFKDDAAPLPVFLHGKPGASEQVYDVCEEYRAGG